MCIIDCLSTIVFILPLHLDYTKVIILILWWRNFQLEYWRTFQLVSTALKVFDDEFDYRETANSRELTDRAVALFVGMMSAQAAPSGGGGGGSSDLPWGRREDEDDREWARRCAREAEKMIGKRPKTGRKR
jgi:hypothetical protein